MKKSMFLMVVVLVSITMMFCTKEGPVGPRGPAGADGTDGNANVITYLITDSAMLAWSGTYIQLYYDSTFIIPDSIINEGVVMMYIKYASSTGFWYPCPGHGPNGTFYTRFALGDLRIAINLLDADGTSWTGVTPPVVTAVRIILIPATTVISMTADKVDINSYEATMDYLGLEK